MRKIKREKRNNKCFFCGKKIGDRLKYCDGADCKKKVVKLYWSRWKIKQDKKKKEIFLTDPAKILKTVKKRETPLREKNKLVVYTRKCIRCRNLFETTEYKHYRVCGDCRRPAQLRKELFS